MSDEPTMSRVPTTIGSPPIEPHHRLVGPGDGEGRKAADPLQAEVVGELLVATCTAPSAEHGPVGPCAANAQFQIANPKESRQRFQMNLI